MHITGADKIPHRNQSDAIQIEKKTQQCERTRFATQFRFPAPSEVPQRKIPPVWPKLKRN